MNFEQWWEKEIRINWIYFSSIQLPIVEKICEFAWDVSIYGTNKGDIMDFEQWWNANQYSNVLHGADNGKNSFNEGQRKIVKKMVSRAWKYSVDVNPQPEETSFVGAVDVNPQYRIKSVVEVRWFDAYKERFECTEVRAGSDLLWMKLVGGKNRHLPLHRIRWFSIDEKE